MVNSKRFLKAVTAGFVVLLLCGVLFGASSSKRSNKRLLRIIPAKSLFCVCINNLENTIEEVNEFLKDVAPPSFDAKTKVLAKLGKLLGDENLSGVNTKGHFAMFGVEVQDTPAGRHPMANMFMGALVPIRNFDRFIAGNPNCSEPDDEGISTITVDGQPRAIATNFRRFVIFCPPNAREKLIQVKEMMGQRRNSLFRALDIGEKEMAATSPIWFYANAKQGSKLVQPILFAGLEKMKAQLQKEKEKGEHMPMDPAAIVGFYSGILKMLLGGTEHITVGISPTSEICNVDVSVKPVPCSEFEKIIGKPVNGSFENLLGYLDNGAWMNIASKIDRKSMNALYMELFDLMGEMTKESISEKQLNKLKKLTTKMINAMGDSLAMSFGLGEESSLFEIKYVIEVGNRKVFKKVINKQLRMMEKGTFNELYKGFGIEMNFEVERDHEIYQDIQIDAAKLNFKMGDEDSLQNQMFQRIWGEGFNYRWAFVDNYCIYSIGGNADKTIRELIDQVKSGHPKKIGSEMKAALDMIPQSKLAEAVGTFNYVRLLDLIPKMMPVTDTKNLSKLEVPSESNIAFACGFDNGNATMQIAVPKKQLLEIKTAFKTLIPQIKKQEELQRQRQREKSKDSSE